METDIKKLTEKSEFLKYYKIGKDEPVIVYYLNAALTNLEALQLQKNDEDTQRQLADFLWLFHIDNPDDYKNDWSKMTNCLINQIKALRNQFSHAELRKDFYDSIMVDDAFYRFLEGKLKNHAMQGAFFPGMEASVLEGINLVRIIQQGKRRDLELTYHGIVFLCCMALYKDEAHEFISQLSGMKKNSLYAKGLNEFFTAFSMRKGRKIIDFDYNFMRFAEMIAYLNKVPSVSSEFLSLKSERDKMEELKNQSTEIEKHKDSKYNIQVRQKEKFASFALGYMDDFGLLPCLKYKCLTTDKIRSSRHSFGVPMDDLDKLNRHYIVQNGAVHFSWNPADGAHYGSIQIKELRGNLSFDELKKILYLSFKFNLSQDINTYIDSYLTAFHRMLEVIVNAADNYELFPLDKVMPQLEILTGYTADELRSDFQAKVTPVIGPALTRLLVKEETSAKSKQERLSDVLQNLIEQSVKTEKRIKTEKVSDALKISAVFQYFNLFTGDFPFRQLPIEKQHRACLDYEYQTIHALIGNYNREPKKLWKHFDKFVQKKVKACDFEKFLTDTKMPRATAMRFIASREEVLKRSGDLKNARTLDELAIIAVQKFRSHLKHILTDFAEQDAAALYKQFNIKDAAGVSRPSTIRTILKIDEQAWKNAYDYDKNCPYTDRDISHSSHVVTQIAFPKNFIETFLRNNANVWKRISHTVLVDKELNKVDFNRAYRDMACYIQLRDYYDTTVLVEWLKENSRKKDDSVVNMPVNSAKRNQVNKAVAQIKEYLVQDKLILQMARKYFEQYHEKVNFSKDSDTFTSVYEFFSDPIDIKINGYVCKATVNDLCKTYFDQVRRQGIALFQILGEKTASFAQLYELFKQIKSADSRIRRTFIMPILRLDAKAGQTPQFSDKAQTAKWLVEKISAFSLETAALCIDFRNKLMHTESFALEDKFKPFDKIKPLLENIGCWENPAAASGSAPVKTQRKPVSHTSSVKVGDVFTGKVIKDYDNCVLISFANNSKGYLYSNETMGQVFNVQITKIQPREGKPDKITLKKV